MSINKQYQMMISRCLYSGDKVTTRNDTCYRTINHVGHFSTTPLVTLRKTAWKTALREFEWFMSGSNNINDLHESVRPWWKPWADGAGIVQYNYSIQFRSYGVHSFDQIEAFVQGIKEHPFSRRNVITTWNTDEMNRKECPITNCHGTIIQAFVDNDYNLTLTTYQRSCDVICGVPHNWIQYWAFLLWLARHTGTKAKALIWTGGDVHVYEKHKELAKKILTVDYPPAVPQLLYNPTSPDFKADDFTLDGEYTYTLSERAEMIV